MRDAIATGSNPQNLGDPVFGLLGDAAAAGGLGDTTDPDCLQQNTADLAFTNAKAAGNVTLMTAALIYRALERNTGAVGGFDFDFLALSTYNRSYLLGLQSNAVSTQLE